MKMVTMIALIATLFASSCYLGGSCPSADELPLIEVESGTFLQRGEVLGANDGVLPAFGDITDATADVDRNDARVVLTYQNAEGQTVRIEYEIVDSRFDIRS